MFISAADEGRPVVGWVDGAAAAARPVRAAQIAYGFIRHCVVKSLP